jgi:hypothetical protein
MVVALGAVDRAIVAAAVGHLGDAVVETEECVEHMNSEAENAETAAEGHTAVAAAAAAAAEVGYKLEEHNWDDSFEQTTE